MIDRIRNISDLHKTFVMMIIWVCVIALLIILSGCSVIDFIMGSSASRIEQTNIALDLRATQLAVQATQLYQGYAETAYATRLAQDVQSTLQNLMQPPNVPHIAQEGKISAGNATQIPSTVASPIINAPPLSTATPAPHGN